MTSAKRTLQVLGVYLLIALCIAVMLLKGAQIVGIPVPSRVYMMLVFSGIACFALVATAMIGRFWRNELRFYDSPPRWWLWGDAGWRACARASPCAPVGLWFLLATGAGFGLADVVDSTSATDVLTDMATGAFILAMLTVVVGLSVALFNRPRLVVAPHQRAERGALVEWRDDIRHRRRRRARP